jgi:small subunit ribosomal protein S11
MAKKKHTKKKTKKNVGHGRVFIKCSFNNTIITCADSKGNVVSWASAGNLGFRGSKKSTPYVAQLTADTAVRKAVELGLSSADVHVKGPGAGRESAVRAVATAGVQVKLIKDVTPIPHNGCRPQKKRRV